MGIGTTEDFACVSTVTSRSALSRKNVGTKEMYCSFIRLLLIKLSRVFTYLSFLLIGVC